MDHIMTCVFEGENQYETDLNQGCENETKYSDTIKRLKKVTMETLTVVTKLMFVKNH